jgi:hypothetical protein
VELLKVYKTAVTEESDQVELKKTVKFYGLFLPLSKIELQTIKERGFREARFGCSSLNPHIAPLSQAASRG